MLRAIRSLGKPYEIRQQVVENAERETWCTPHEKLPTGQFNLSSLVIVAEIHLFVDTIFGRETHHQLGDWYCDGLRCRLIVTIARFGAG